MKTHDVFIIILLICIIGSVLFSCTNRNKSMSEKNLEELFQTNEQLWASVVNELESINIEHGTYKLNQKKIVEDAYDFDKNMVFLSKECKNVIKQCLQVMENFLETHYELSNFNVSISIRELSGYNSMVIEFNFRDIKRYVDYGFLYSSDITDYGCKLKDNWYLYSYALE